MSYTHKHSTNNTKYSYKSIPIFADSEDPHKIITKQIEESLPNGGSVLDLGAGAGALSQRLMDLGYRVTAADLDEATFLANGEFITVNLNENFLGKFGNKKYDCIVASEVLEHLDNPLRFLSTVKELLTDSGFIMISFPNIYIYTAIISFLRGGSFVNWDAQHYWQTGHKTILPDWLFEQHCKKSDLVVVNKIFCSKIPFPKNMIKRLAIRLFLKLIRVVSKGVTYQMRTSDNVIFKVVKK